MMMSQMAVLGFGLCAPQCVCHSRNHLLRRPTKMTIGMMIFDRNFLLLRFGLSNRNRSFWILNNAFLPIYLFFCFIFVFIICSLRWPRWQNVCLCQCSVRTQNGKRTRLDSSLGIDDFSFRIIFSIVNSLSFSSGFSHRATGWHR